MCEGRPELRDHPLRAVFAGAALCMALGASVAEGDTIITDFTGIPPGSYASRAGWTAFGPATTDRGVIAAGAIGPGAFHSVNWNLGGWGVGDAEITRNLTGFGAIRVTARMVDTGSYTGAAELALELVTPDLTTWSTPAVAIGPSYQTYTFSFADLRRIAGSWPLDLAHVKIEFIIDRNSQAGSARFDFDEVTAVDLDAVFDGYNLHSVTRLEPPDGDAVRALWIYPGAFVDDEPQMQHVLDFCAAQAIKDLYLDASGIWASGTFGQQNHLRNFITVAHSSGIRVEALDGDTHWQQDAALVRSRLRQVLTFQQATPEDVRDDFDGIHYDVEFWRDPTWLVAADEAARRQIARDYLGNVLVNARDYLDASGAAAMKIGVDLSAHLEGTSALPTPFVYGASTQPFLGHVLDLSDDVVIMSYIDFASGLLGWAQFELDVGVAKGTSLRLAADIEPVPTEEPINSFWDNLPTAYEAMTSELTTFHSLLTQSERSALEGFAIFHYSGFEAKAPPVDAGVVIGVDNAAATSFASHSIAPNPFSRATTLRFDLARPDAARLTIFDVAGRHVRTLLDGVLRAGRHQVVWDGRDEAGVPVDAGIYFCSLEAGMMRKTTRVIRMAPNE